MDNKDPNGAVSRIVNVLREITRIVQIAPFVYLSFYAAYLLLTVFMLPDWVVLFADCVLNTPICVVAGMLFLGRILKLCNWFRTACLLPTAAKVEGYVDSFIITFTQNEVIIINTAIGILFITYIYLSYRHFFSCKTK